MTGPDMSKPGPSAEPGAYDQTQLRDVSKLDLNKQDPVDDFTPAQPSDPGYAQPSNPGYAQHSNPGYEQSSNPGYQQPSAPYVAPGAIGQPGYPGYATPSYQQPYGQTPYTPGYPAAQPYGSPYPGYPGYGYTATTTNTKAVVAMILGILGITATCGVLGIPGLILGYIGKREIDESNGTQDGGGMALAGIILGWISVAFLVLFILYILIMIAVSS